MQILLEFVPIDPFDKKTALVQVMACRLLGDKPLPEPMLTKMNAAIWHHQATMSYPFFVSRKNKVY